MTWNGRKLMSYTKGDDVITYKYDGNGLRTQKIINGVKHDYYYENGQLLYEIKQGVYELYYKYDADGKLFSVTRYRYSDGEKHVAYAVTNTRGDVIELRSSTGAIYAKYVYDSWGKCISVTDSSGEACSVNTVAVQNSIRYRGYVYDNETGLYYLQSRYYDPEVGRFLNADDEYILNSMLLIEVLQNFQKNFKVKFQEKFKVKSTYSLSASNDNIYDIIGDALEASVWLSMAAELYEQNNIDTHYLTYGTVDVDAQKFYQVNNSDDSVIKVTIMAMGDKNYDSLTSGYYQTIYETVFYTGKWDAWSLYVSNSLASRQKEYTLGGLLLNLFSVFVGVISFFNPKSAFFKLASALDTSIGVLGGTSGSLGWFELAQVAKFDNYILNLLNKTYGTDNITFLFSVIDRSIVYANEKREIIYKVDLNK